jgi:hypothetical protein
VELRIFNSHERNFIHQLSNVQGRGERELLASKIHTVIVSPEVMPLQKHEGVRDRG